MRVVINPNTLGAPDWALDFGGREHIVPFPARVDPTAFEDQSGIRVQATANAVVTATSIAVVALTGKVPAGTTLYFGAGKMARSTADALAGATSVPVEALVAQVNNGDHAVYSFLKVKYLKSGTPVGRTTAERLANTAFGPAAATDDEVYLTYFDNPDMNVSGDIELYRHGGVVAENYLPAETLAILAANGALKTLLYSLYVMTTGES